MGSRSRSAHCSRTLWYPTLARIASLKRQIERRKREIEKLKARLKWEKRQREAD